MLTDMKKFVLAGNATFTISSPKDGGKHFTYKVTMAKDDPASAVLDYAFVKVLTGRDNTRDYTYAGVIDLRDREWTPGHTFRNTKGSKIGIDALSCRVFEFFMRWFVWGKEQLPPGYDIQHAGRCGRCNRLLTETESLRTGIGPECRRVMGL